jgi:hypothetical protein
MPSFSGILTAPRQKPFANSRLHLRKWQRILNYALSKSPRYLFLYPLNWLARKLNQRFVTTKYSGITLYCMALDTTYKQDFLEVMEDALKLIEQYDPKRFRRIQKHVDIINLNPILLSWGSYDIAQRTCEINFASLPFSRQHKDYTEYLTLYACLLVHEATHGWLTSLYITYEGDKRIRIERICQREEARFLVHLPVALHYFPSVTKQVTFDETRWQDSWAISPEETKRRRWKLVRAEWKKGFSKKG